MSILTYDQELVLHRSVGYLKSLVDNGKRLAQLPLVNAQGGIGIERVPAHNGIQPLLPKETAQSAHLLRSAVKWRHRLPSFAAADEFDDAEQSDGPHSSNRRVFGLEFGAQLLHHIAHLLRIFDKVVFLVHANRR